MTVAVFEAAPPRPLARGMFFSIVIVIVSEVLACFRVNSAALCTCEVSSVGTAGSEHFISMLEGDDLVGLASIVMKSGLKSWAFSGVISWRTVWMKW